MPPNDSSEADKWTPSNYVRNLTYIVREVGMTGLVILFLLGQRSGHVPDVNKEEHERMMSIVTANLQISDANGQKLDRNALNILRTKDYAQQACLEGKPKTEFYKCIDGYEWTLPNK